MAKLLSWLTVLAFCALVFVTLADEEDIDAKLPSALFTLFGRAEK